MSIEDISSKLANLMTQFDNFSIRFEILSSGVALSKKCNRLLSERIIQLERNAVNNAQYHQRKSIEINPVRCKSIEVNPVPASISNEEVIYKALSLTGHEVIRNRNEKFLLTGKISIINLKTIIN